MGDKTSGLVSRVAPQNRVECLDDAGHLATWLRRLYGLEVTSVIRMKTVMGVLTSDGDKYVWKPIREDTSHVRLHIVARIAQRLSTYGITIAGPLWNRQGALQSALPDGTVGYLQPWLSGRHVNVCNQQERLSALAAVGHLHQCATTQEVFDVPELYRIPLYAKLHVKAETFRTVWPSVTSAVPALQDIERDVFDIIDDVCACAQEMAGMPVWSFCHRDLAPHNVMWRGVQDVAFIDFDQAGIDDPFIDVVQWSNHTVFLEGAQSRHFTNMVDIYAQSVNLSAARIACLWRLLRFPDILIRTASEWVKAGYPLDQRHRLVSAALKERARWRVWEEDYV